MTPEEIEFASQTTDRELRQKIWARVQAAAYRYDAFMRYGRKGL